MSSNEDSSPDADVVESSGTIITELGATFTKSSEFASESVSFVVGEEDFSDVTCCTLLFDGDFITSLLSDSRN